MTNLNNALVLITGASGGFGRQMTAQFLQAGCDLIVSDRDEGALHTLQAEFSGQATRIRGAIPADLSLQNGPEELLTGVQALGLQPDVLVNNAGIAVSGRFDHVPQERWETLMQINLLAPMRLCTLFMPQMIARRSGHIVNIASLAGWIGSPGIAAYCASKFGLHGFSESIAAELEEFNVRVSAVYPCFSRTPILDSEQFGYAVRRTVPDDMVSDPADVVTAIIRGIRRDRLHIFPDKLARRIHYLKRFFPGLIPKLNKRMQEKSIQPG
ncbi:MAG: short-subunit dehydrogenase [Woeseiaceae bacterium]|jgi:short-subunit dehydrogenase